jgi:hypothetical protein
LIAQFLIDLQRGKLVLRDAVSRLVESPERQAKSVQGGRLGMEVPEDRLEPGPRTGRKALHYIQVTENQARIAQFAVAFRPKSRYGYAGVAVPLGR